MKEAEKTPAAAKPDEMVAVEATATGYYQRIRHPGERFEVPARLVSKTWMKRVERSDAGDDAKRGKSPEPSAAGKDAAPGKAPSGAARRD